MTYFYRFVMSNTTASTLGGYSGPEIAFATNYSRMFLVGNMLSILAYGTLLAFLAAIVPLVWATRGSAMSARRWRLYETLVFIATLFVLNSLYIISTMLMTESAYVDNANYPGGVFAYSASFPEQAVGIINQVSFVTGSLLADAFLLIRTRAIFRAVGGKYSQLLLIPGVVMLVLSTLLSIFYSIDLVSPTGLFGDETTNWASLYFIISFVENAYLTLLITLRISMYTRGTNKALGGGSGYAHIYATFCTMFIESAALYSVVALGGVVTYNNPMNMIWQSLSLPVQTIASFLITYRIARGQAWEVSALNSTVGELRVRVRVDESVVMDIAESKTADDTWV